MFFLRIVCLLSVSLVVLSGCMFVPLMEDKDPDYLERTSAQQDAARRERMARNPNINQTEYEAMNRNSNAPKPKPTVADLERQVEADKASQ